MKMTMVTRFAGKTIGAVGAFLFVTGCGSEGPSEDDALGTASSALGTADSAMNQEALSKFMPKARMHVRGGRVVRLSGAVMATGTTPNASTEAFRRNTAPQFGAVAGELIPVKLRSGRLIVAAQPEAEGVMLDPTTGEYRFWLYRYAQVRSSVPVHGASLLTLVKNTTDHPVVWAASSLRDLGGLAVPSRAAVPAVDADRSLQALEPVVDQFGNARALPSTLVFGEPELVIYAGSGDEVLDPRLATRYVGASDNPLGTWRFIADATTGDILHVANIVESANVGGRVRGKATQGHVASQCAPEAAAALPYAEVGITGGSQGFTSSAGYYLLSAGTTAVTVVSSMAGRRFDVFDLAGSLEQLSLTVTPPTSSANFVHNNANTAEYVRAQVNGYVFANQARGFVLGYLPSYPTIVSEEDFPVNVNRNDGYCPGNGWYEPDPAQPDFGINLCRASAGFTNTAFGSFVQHEYGHHIIAMGMGTTAGQGAYGEGMADSIAVSIAGNSRVFPGLVENNCDYTERNADNTCQYSSTACSSCGDFGNPWGCGMLLSGIIWDIRERLMVTHPTDYATIINRLMLSSIELHSGLTSIGPEIADDFLTLDDDDGESDNGTPHRTEICEGFAAHGIQCPALPANNPCASFCSNPVVVSWGSDYESGPLGTGAVCRETTQTLSGGNCGNFASGRVLYVNGIQMTCTGANWTSIPAAVNGGHCVTTTAGQYSYAFFTLW